MKKQHGFNNLFRISILILLFCTYSQAVHSQIVLLEENVKDLDLEKPVYGANHRHFTHFYVGYEFITDKVKGEGLEVVLGRSMAILSGYRYKLKLAKYLAVGADIDYFYMSYFLKQNDSKVVPNNIKHELERLIFHNLGTEFYVRVNFGRRGNSIGKFIDVATYANWAFSQKHYYEDKIDDKNNPYRNGLIKVTNKKLNYINDFNYGLRARLGFGKLVFSATYRITDMFTKDLKKDVADVELPRVSIGLQLGLHN